MRLTAFSNSTKVADFTNRCFCENFEIAAVQKDANLVELEKCCRTHMFLQNFVLIQPRTSPPKLCKNWFWNMQNFAKSYMLSFVQRSASGTSSTRTSGPTRPSSFMPRTRGVVANSWPILGKFRSFSAVSAPIFATKYAFCSNFQNLPDYLAEIFEIWQNFAIKFLPNVAEFNFTIIVDCSNRFVAKILRSQRCKSMQIL